MSKDSLPFNLHTSFKFPNCPNNALNNKSILSRIMRYTLFQCFSSFLSSLAFITLTLHSNLTDLHARVLVLVLSETILSYMFLPVISSFISTSLCSKTTFLVRHCLTWREISTRSVDISYLPSLLFLASANRYLTCYDLIDFSFVTICLVHQSINSKKGKDFPGLFTTVFPVFTAE